MDFLVWFSFFFTALAVILIPGPSSLNQTRIGACYSGLSGFYAALGGICASNCYLILSFLLSVGILNFSTDSNILDVGKILGCSFIIYLGIKTYFTKRVGDIQYGDLRVETPADMFKSGFLVGISNPKDIVFWLALMPQFIHTGTLSECLIFSATWSILDLGIMTAYSVCSEWLSKNSETLNKYITKITGVCLFLIGGYGLLTIL